MINKGKHSILGVHVHAVDYAYAVDRILDAAEHRHPFAVSALAVHGVMTGAQDPIHRRRLNGLDLVVPDGQPVRWALRWLHGRSLPDRVYGPALTLRVLHEAARRRLPVYFYGSTDTTLGLLVNNLCARFPDLIVAGAEASRFRKLTGDEKADLVARIRTSGARVVFVGLGCPRQEVWAYEYRTELSIPILAVGAAFDFHAGTVPQAPAWMQAGGLEWLFRLSQEPRRLWKRYVLLNPSYLIRLAFQKLTVASPPPLLPDGREPIESYG